MARHPTALHPDRSLPWVVGLTVLALVVRVVGLNSGLWIDEIYALVRSFRSPLATILTEYWGDNHHPLYALLAHASRGAFGEAAWTLRLPAALFGVAAIPALFALASPLLPRREALLAAALLAVSYHHVWFSQNARGYSAIATFTIVALWALVQGVATGERKYWVAYVLSAILGAYTHLTMVMVVVGHAAGVACWWLMNRRDPAAPRALRAAATVFTLSAVGTLALYAPMLADVVRYFTEVPSGLKGVSTPAWALQEAVRVLAQGLGAGRLLLGLVLVGSGVLVGAAGIISLWRTHRLFLLALAGSLVVTVAGALAARGTMYPRFFFFAIGPAILVIVRGGFAAVDLLLASRASARTRGALATAATLAVILLSTASLGLNYRYPKQDFQGAMSYILANREAADRVVSTGLLADPYRMLYGQDWPSIGSRAELDSVRRTAPRTWVVWTFPRYLEQASPDIGRLLRDECPRPRVFRGTVGGGDVMVCALPAPTAATPSGSLARQAGNFHAP